MKQPLSNPPLRLTSCGHALDTTPESFGRLETSTDFLPDTAILRERMEKCGYLFFPGFRRREKILAVRRSITERLAAEELLHPEHPPLEAVPRPGPRLPFRPELVKDNAEIS